jgi:hypothetical protein
LAPVRQSWGSVNQSCLVWRFAAAHSWRIWNRVVVAHAIDSSSCSSVHHCTECKNSRFHAHDGAGVDAVLGSTSSNCTAEQPRLDKAVAVMQFLPPTDPKYRAEGAPSTVLSNSERAARSLEPLTLVNYVLNSPLPIGRYPHNTHLEVHFSREQLQQAARHMKKRCLWGIGIYTADSDLFCALIHAGYLPWRSLESSYSWPDNMRELRAIIEVLPSPPSYAGSSQNGIRSRAWGSACHNCAFAIRRCWMAVLLAQQSNMV